MPPKNLLTPEASEAPPPFVVRRADEDWGVTLSAHQQRVMHQPFLQMQVPHNAAEPRSSVLQDLLNTATVPHGVVSKLMPTIPPQRLYDGCDARSFVRVRQPHEEWDRPLKATDGTVVQKVAGKKDAVILMPRLNASGTMLDAIPVLVDGVFGGPKEDNDFVYECVVPPMLQLVVSGGAAAVVGFGETGSGKSHTIFGLLRNACKDLESIWETHTIYLCALELQVASVLDLLSDEPVQLVEGDQNMIFEGAAEPEMVSPEMLHKLVEALATRRARSAKNSAKTHMIVRISCRNKRTSWAKPGCLMFADLAGSEKALDVEFRHLAAAFTALKDCIRIRAVQKANQTASEGRLPLRTTSLTFCLKDVLEVSSRATKLCMMHCVSPSYSRLRHTVETMRMATLCCVHPGEFSVPPMPIIPQFSYADCCDFLSKSSFGRLKTALLMETADVLPKGMDGRRMLNLSEEAFVKMLTDSPLAIPTRIAKTLFTTMQAIGIATKTLGPSGKFGQGTKPPLVLAAPTPSTAATAQASSVASPRLAKERVTPPASAAGPASPNSNTPSELPIPRTNSVHGKRSAIPTLPTIPSARK